jgi:hypothetical protein
VYEAVGYLDSPCTITAAGPVQDAAPNVPYGCVGQRKLHLRRHSGELLAGQVVQLPRQSDPSARATSKESRSWQPRISTDLRVGADHRQSLNVTGLSVDKTPGTPI